MKKPKIPFGNRTLRKLYSQVEKIDNLKHGLYKLSDEELQAKTDEFRQRLANGETLDDLMIEAYAVVREASRRATGMEHYPVQIIGGIVLHEGKIAEMQTGEGKTLVSTLPAYLNALTGEGVHVITVNDYLAERDADLMRPVHEFLGLTVGSVLGGMSPEERREAYAADITYLTNHELGFDYLRDNMAKTKDQLVQRGLHYVIIDEIDSVLIDDARTPLIISGATPRSTAIYFVCDVLARYMKRGKDLPKLTKMDYLAGAKAEETGHFIIDEQDKKVLLTEEGMGLIERFFRINNIADLDNIQIMHHMLLALRANYLMKVNHDYIVKDGEVMIVDQNTGRVMSGRRFSDGLHQAIEAKERVRVQQESRTIATITYQSLFNKYEKKSGMTGTGSAEAAEFRDTYNMEIVPIPTNRPILRIDREDVVFRTNEDKFQAICDVVEECLETDQPILVGTTSVMASEELSEMLTARGIEHQVLNAKYHDLEAAIVAEAGKEGAVTIATNMAGRGTDIKLTKKSKEAGGLLVIGSERYESSRVDGQLCGRSGRQGDPGESRFYLSLEDDLLRLFGSKKLMSAFDSAKIEEGAGITNPMLSKAIQQAQRTVEHIYQQQRKRVLDYDKVIDLQREVIYQQRREVLETDDMRAVIVGFIEAVVDDAFDIARAEEEAMLQTGLEDEVFGDAAVEEEISEAELVIAPFEKVLTPGKIRYLKTLEGDDLRKLLIHDLTERYEAIEESFTDHDYLQEREREVLLDAVDHHWAQHVEDIEQLRLGIGLVSYANQDPVVEFQKRTAAMFDQTCRAIRMDAVTDLLEDGSPEEYHAPEHIGGFGGFGVSRSNRAETE